MKQYLLGALASILAVPAVAQGVELGSVDTTFRLVGKNDRIVVERFDDPLVENASCYVSHAETGGVLSALAEDRSRFSIACRATGPVVITEGSVPTDFEDVFTKDTSILFKETTVSRLFDAEKQTLVYLVWSSKLIDGSPFNSITAIVVDEVRQE